MDEGSEEMYNIDDYVGNEFVPWDQLLFNDNENQDAISEESNQVLQPEVSSNDALSSAPTTDMSAKQSKKNIKSAKSSKKNKLNLPLFPKSSKSKPVKKNETNNEYHVFPKSIKSSKTQGNLCTTDYCDIPTETCKTETLICGDNEACDAFSGKCRNVQSVIPCVAVIDEWDNQDFTQEWEDFRRQYPQRPFCLLVPETRFDFDRLHRM